MSGEVPVPPLPCASIGDVAYAALGFETTYRQTKPNPYPALRRVDLHLHLFGMPDFDPAQSYGSCLVQVTDTGELYEAFAAGMGTAYGRVLTTGIPQMTRPRGAGSSYRLGSGSAADRGATVPPALSRAEPSTPVLTPPVERGQRRLEPSGRRSAR